MPKGHVRPHDNPESAFNAAPVGDEEERPETHQESEADAAWASGGTTSLAEEASSSRSTLPDTEVHEVPSGSSTSRL